MFACLALEWCLAQFLRARASLKLPSVQLPFAVGTEGRKEERQQGGPCPCSLDGSPSLLDLAYAPVSSLLPFEGIALQTDVFAPLSLSLLQQDNGQPHYYNPQAPYDPSPYPPPHAPPTPAPPLPPPSPANVYGYADPYAQPQQQHYTGGGGHHVGFSSPPPPSHTPIPFQHGGYTSPPPPDQGIPMSQFASATRYDSHASSMTSPSYPNMLSVAGGGTPQPYPSPGVGPAYDDWDDLGRSGRPSISEDDHQQLLPGGGRGPAGGAGARAIPGGWDDGASVVGRDLADGGDDDVNAHYGPAPARLPRRNKSA